MLTLATAAQMQEIDRLAIEQHGVSSLTLMENAAHAVVDAVDSLIGGPDKRTFCSASVFVSDRDKVRSKEEQTQVDELRNIVESKNNDPTPRVAVFCGPGNNGGDGLAAARLLMARGGCKVRIFFVGDRGKMTEDEKAMEMRLFMSGRRIEDFLVDMTSSETLEETLDYEQQKILMWLSTCDCMVDCLFGIGLNRPLEGVFRSAVRQMNGQTCPVVACDIPSGVHADTGEILGEAVHAKITVTFTLPKPGLYLGEGGAYAGEVRVCSIGIPDVVPSHFLRQVPRLEVMQHPNASLPLRPRTAHKGDFGKIFLLGGSEGLTGAPVLAARAALRTGAGLVYLGVPRDIYPIVAVKCDEAMPFPLPEENEAVLEKARRCDVALIGPGAGRSAQTEQLILFLLEHLELPVVLDADGINALAGHIDILDSRTAPTILTPHEGEFARLLGTAPPVQDPLRAAQDFAQTHHCVLVLKGHRTITAAPNGAVQIADAGNPGMAKGGSGDVLAGVIAALLGQKHLGTRKSEAAQLFSEDALLFSQTVSTLWVAQLSADAVLFHALAGDACAKRLGEYAMLPSDLIEALPEVLRQWEDEPR